MSDYKNKNKQEDLSSWIFPIIMLMVFPPVGVLLVVLKLLDGSRRTDRGRHPYYDQTRGQASPGSRTVSSPSARAEQPAATVRGMKEEAAGQKKAATGKKGKDPLQGRMAQLSAKAKRLTTVGAIISAIFGFVTLVTLGESAYWLFNGNIGWFLSEVMELLPIYCFMAGGLGCLWAGLRQRKKVRRYRNYLAMIGKRQTISISALAAATGHSHNKVRDDLADMLNDGLFPQGYLDYGGDMLVLSADGLNAEADQPRQAARPKQAKTATPNEENAILAEIREVNDAIANEKLSAQIDHIGVITAKILEYQKSRPEKAAQLHSFLSYYLPTTLKILRAYGQLEAQDISGANITSAMDRIEGMMDKVVEGFEKQLDQLFQGDAMDITTDVEVLERMLAKDGLSDQQGMTLGF